MSMFMYQQILAIPSKKLKPPMTLGTIRSSECYTYICFINNTQFHYRNGCKYHNETGNLKNIENWEDCFK